MKHSKGLILLCIAATLGLTGCPDDDDPVIPAQPGPAAAEVAIENALESVVDPLMALVEFVGGIGGLSRSTGPTDGIGCPDTSGWCAPGSATCDVSLTGLDLVFNGCNVVASSEHLTIDGPMTVTPTGESSGSAVLTGVSINGSPLLNGQLNVGVCTVTWSVSAADGTSSSADLDVCDDYPPADSTLVFNIDGAGFWVISFTFNGTSTASAITTVDGEPIAMCNVNLDTLDATCSDPI